ncbi:MAG TPA: hypothetical protein VNM14_12685 [Planctomycetota bacterium]|jgi:hypothetical protein|nr:hypothetical protein [Planctomycetota bacterium]
MPNGDRDPIRSVKAFLQGQPSASAAGRLAGDLHEIRERLDRARRVDGRVSASEALEALLAAGESPSA